MLASDLRSEIRWLSSGFLLMLCSGYGQTYFIALFAGELKADLALSLEIQLLAMAVYCFVAALWMSSLQPRLNRLATA